MFRPLKKVSNSIRKSQSQSDKTAKFANKNKPNKKAKISIQKSHKQNRLKRISRFLLILFTTFVLMLQLSGLGLLFTLEPAYAATSLAIEPITWDFVGLDSNKPESQGPNTYVVGARVCNLGSEDAVNVKARFNKDGIDNGYTFIRLQGADTYTFDRLPANIPANQVGIRQTTGQLGYVFDTSTNGGARKTKYNINYTPINCQDFYYNFEVTRSPSAWQTYQRYYIEAWADNVAGFVTTPRPRQIYIEQMISQARNTVNSFTCKGASGSVDVEVGEEFECIMNAYTSTAYPQLTTTSDIPNVIFQVLDVSTTYSSPSGGVNSTVYADGCGWVQDPTDPRYHNVSLQCNGETGGNGRVYTDQYPFGSTKGATGNAITTKYRLKVIKFPGALGLSNTVQVSNIILDNSGGSYHYNADYGIGANVIQITVVDKKADLLVNKYHSGSFVIGPNVYTIDVTNNGPDTARGPLTVEDTLPPYFEYLGLDAGTSSGWVCSVSSDGNDATSDKLICTNPNDLNNGATSTIKLRVNVKPGVASNNINTVTVSSATPDPVLTNNTDTDPTLIVEAANLRLFKDDTDPDTDGTLNGLPDNVVSGQQMTFNFNVTNQSATVIAKAPITISDVLPTGLTYASHSGTNWNCAIDGQNITCTYNQDIAANNGTAPTLTLVVDTNNSAITSGTSKVIENIATVSSASLESDKDDNTSRDSFTLTLPVSDLTINKTDYNASFLVTGAQNTGQSLSYNITIQNKGVVATTGPIEIREQLPSFIGGATSYPVKYVSHTGIGPNGSTAINWSCTTGINPTSATTCGSTTTGDVTFTYNGSLAPGETAQLNLIVLGPSVAPTVLNIPKTTTNNVTVYNANDGSTQTKTDAETTPIVSGNKQQDLVVTKELTSTGSPLTAPTGCTNTSLLVIPSNIINESFNQTCPTTVTPGTSIRYTIKVENANNAGASGETFNLSDFIPNEINITNVTCAIISGYVGSDCIGGNASNQDGWTGANNSNGAPSPVVVNFSLVDNTISPPLYQIQQSATLAKNGGTAQYVIDGSLKNPTQLAALGGNVNTTIRNIARVPIDNGVDTDVQPLNNLASTSFTLNATDLEIRKTDDPTFTNDPGNISFVAGAEGIYVLRVTNVDTRSTVGEINVVDDLPDEFEFLYATGTDWTCTILDPTNPNTTIDPAGGVNNNIVTCSRAVPLAGGSSSDIRIAVRPLSDWVAANEIFTNLAQVSTAGDNNAANNGNAPGATSPNTTYGYEQTPVIAPNVDLKVTKSVSSPSSGQFTTGQPGSYQITVLNNGPTVATASSTTPIRVTDTIPNGLSYISSVGAGWACNYVESTRLLTCDRTSNLGVNIPTTITVNVIVENASNLVSNTVDVAKHPDETVGNYVTNDNNSNSRNRHTISTVVNTTADLSIIKTDIGEPWITGETKTYNLRISNNGPSDSVASLTNQITVTDILPANLTFAIAGSGGGGFTCSASGQTVTCLRPTNMTAGETVNITLNVNVVTAGNITNTASVAASLTPDPVSGNNTDSETTTIQTNTSTLVLVKDDNDGVGEPSNAALQTKFIRGSEGRYTLVVTNNGPASAKIPVRISDNFPSGLTYAGSSLTSNWACTGTIGAPSVTCDYGLWTDTNNDGNRFNDANGFTQLDLPAGTTSGVEIRVNVLDTAPLSTLSGGVYTNLLTNPGSVTSDNGGAASASEQTAIIEPADLSVSKTIDSSPINGTGTYTVTVTNNGPGTSEADLYVVDFLPDGLAYNGTFPSSTSCTPQSRGNGWQLVTCLGTEDNADDIRDLLFKRSTALPATTGSNTTTFTIPVKVLTGAPAAVRNLVRVTGTTPEPDNPNIAVCDRDFSTQPVNNCFVTETPITGGLTVGILKKHPATDNGTIDVVQDGAEVTFTIEVSNTNNVAVNNVIISDKLPAGLTFKSVEITQNPNSTIGSTTVPRQCIKIDTATGTEISCNLRTVSTTENASNPIKIALTVKANGVAGTIITNTATIISGGSGNDPESIKIDGIGIPKLLLVKRITAINDIQINGYVAGTSSPNTGTDATDIKWPGSSNFTANPQYLRGAIACNATSGTDCNSIKGVKPGDNVEYTIYFLSNGTENLKDVKICDRIPANTTFQTGTYDAGVGLKGILLGWNSDSTGSPVDPSDSVLGATKIALTNAPNDDKGTFFAKGDTDADAICGDNTNTPVNTTNGAVFVQVVSSSTTPAILPKADSSGSPPNSYGFVRFNVKVN